MRAESLIKLEDWLRTQFEAPIITEEEADRQALLLLPLAEEYLMKEMSEEQRSALAFESRDELLSFIEAIGENLVPGDKALQVPLKGTQLPLI